MRLASAHSSSFERCCAARAHRDERKPMQFDSVVSVCSFVFMRCQLLSDGEESRVSIRGTFLSCSFTGQLSFPDSF